MKKYNNKLLKHIHINAFLLVLCLIILVYLAIYIYFVYPLYNLSVIQNKEEIRLLTEQIVIGTTNHSILNKINGVNKSISFLYYFFLLKSKKYTIWCIFHKHHQYSNNGNIKLYYYDHINKKNESDVLSIDMRKLKTFKRGEILCIQYLNNYYQEIDFQNNSILIHIETPKNKINMRLAIDEYNTTMPPLLYRYRMLNYISQTNLIETQSPNEWASDNPLIGKILSGSFNNDIIETNGNFWFDNFIGCNNFFLSEYYWFLTLNDDWLIYILFYGKYEDINTSNVSIPLFIKDRKNNKIIHCSPGVMPSMYKPIENIVHPIKIEYSSNPYKRFGDLIFDDYELKFTSNEITINMKSVLNESVQVVKYDYYKDAKFNKSMLNTKWDRKYYDVLDNLGYVEYINKVDIDILYNGEKQSFRCDHILDAVIVKDKTKPSTIKYGS